MGSIIVRTATAAAAANQAELEAIVASKPKFSDIFDQVNPRNGTLTCPAGYTAANTPINRLYPQ
jgi:hypothetical protein